MQESFLLLQVWVVLAIYSLQTLPLQEEIHYNHFCKFVKHVTRYEMDKVRRLKRTDNFQIDGVMHLEDAQKLILISSTITL